MPFSPLCDHRCRARSAHRIRNLRFMTRTYANASSQRVHRVSKHLHKTCAKPPKTPSSEKSGFVAFFVAIVSRSTAIATTAGARQLAPTPAEGRCPTPTVGLVGASHCGTRPNVARPQATQCGPGFREPDAGVVSLPRTHESHARWLATLGSDQRVAGYGETAIGDRRCVCDVGVVGASHASPSIRHDSLSWPQTGVAVANKRGHAKIALRMWPSIK